MGKESEGIRGRKDESMEVATEDKITAGESGRRDPRWLSHIQSDAAVHICELQHQAKQAKHVSRTFKLESRQNCFSDSF